MSGGVIRPSSTAAITDRSPNRLPGKPVGTVPAWGGELGKRPIRVGTRGSQLARAQADWVAGRLRELSPGRDVELIEVRTTGDRAPDARMREIGGEGLFTRELQNALLSQQIDVAVHSLKDLPTSSPSGLIVGAIPVRAPALDVLVSPYGDWRSLPNGARIGTSSPRRRAQLLRLRSDLIIEEIRGNVPTRLRKIDDMALGGVVLAHAGLQRLGLESRITYRFTADEMLPAPGQGAIAIECRNDHREIIDLLMTLDDTATRAATTAERAVLAELQGGCHMPLGAYATVANDQIGLRAAVFDDDGRHCVADSIAGTVIQAESIGRRLAEKLLAAGARDFN
jgi:hydroxymethylbilane synthase